jgi:hypothetical protein
MSDGRRSTSGSDHVLGPTGPDMNPSARGHAIRVFAMRVVTVER